jgi:hypothetical protein
LAGFIKFRPKNMRIFHGLEKMAVATPSFADGYSATPEGPQATVLATFAAAQTAENLNVVVVGWNDTTARAPSIVDSKENTHQLAGTPTALSGALSQSIYYVKKIVASAMAFLGSVQATSDRPEKEFSSWAKLSQH